MKPLRCPYCGGALAAIMEWRGQAYMQERVFAGMECEDYKCGGEWDAQGRGVAMPLPPATTCTA